VEETDELTQAEDGEHQYLKVTGKVSRARERSSKETE
jgi:hypothetical protein